MERDFLNILLVERDLDNHILIRKLLSESFGNRYQLESVSAHEDALEAMENGDHDAYLIDYHLGEKTGLELVSAAVEKGFRAPSIMLAEPGDRDIDLASIKAGAATYLVKDQLTAELLERAIRYAIEKAHTDREKDKLQSKFLHAQKMEAISSLAGGIAHEFNNALFGITGNLDLMEMKFKGQDKIIQSYINPMRASAKRMADLTSQLLSYAKGGKYQLKKIDLKDFIDYTLPLIKHQISPKIKIETSLDADDVQIEADLMQMQAALSAIFMNAAEAIKEQGRISLETKKITLKRSVSKPLHDLEPGSFILVSVEDNGTGMDEKTKNRIFEPFFTTKAQGRGLGLAAVYGIIQNHNGDLIVESKPGKWTRISIYLPIAEADEKEASEPEADPHEGSGTILVIEDEEQVMCLSRMILEKLGYSVVEAKTGKEALDVMRDRSEEIDLAMLDIGLPDIGGEYVYRRIKEIRPDMKVIVCSGYSLDGIAQEILDEGAHGFIQKPYGIPELSAKLKNILGSHHPTTA